MTEYNIEAVWVEHLAGWNKWPATEDTDFAEILQHRKIGVFRRGDDTLNVTYRTLPAYLAYLVADDKNLSYPYPYINNLKLPSEKVITAQLKLLEEYAKDCRVIVWDHGRQCPLPVAKALPELFNFSLLIYADDCPLSSPHQSFPIAPFFDAIYYFMDVWDLSTGERTSDKYKELGVKYLCHGSSNSSNGLERWIVDTGFDVEAKAQAVAQGTFPAHDLVWVGLNPALPHPRGVFMGKLLAYLSTTSTLKTCIRGYNTPDGRTSIDYTLGHGYTAAPVYKDALFGLNYPFSSIWNSRLMDLWRMGVVQVVFDPHGELARAGFVENEHYLKFDGTPEGLAATLLHWKAQPVELARIIRTAYAKLLAWETPNRWTADFANTYFDNLPQILHGRHA